MAKNLARVLAALPAIVFTIEDQLANGDNVVARYTAVGTHYGALQGRTDGVRHGQSVGRRLEQGMQMPAEPSPTPPPAAGAQAQWQAQALIAAEGYERYAVPALTRPWALDLLTAAAVAAGERVLDVACGTGIVARLAAAPVGPAGRVVGVDINPAMLAVARSVSAGAPIEWREGSADALPFADAAFDLVCCLQGLQFFAERGRALREMRRVLAPGGRLVLTVWQALAHNPAHAAVAAVLAGHGATNAAAVLMTAFSLDSVDELVALIEAAGFGVPTVRSAVKSHHFAPADAFVDGLVPRDLPEATRTALLEEARAALRPYTEGDALVFPMAARIAVARAEPTLPA